MRLLFVNQVGTAVLIVFAEPSKKARKLRGLGWYGGVDSIRKI